MIFDEFYFLFANLIQVSFTVACILTKAKSLPVVPDKDNVSTDKSTAFKTSGSCITAVVGTVLKPVFGETYQMY